MSGDPIPDDVKQYVLEHIDSVAQLEGLLLLRGNPEKGWVVDEVAQRLYIDRGQTADLMGRLSALGLITEEGGGGPAYRYHPRSPGLKDLVDRLAETYVKYLVPVTNLIHAKPPAKVQQFADAFRLKERKE